MFGVDEYHSDDVNVAVAQSQLQQDLPRYSAGLAHKIGENGSRLSGGQSQRVRVARALLQRAPRLVLLDEPFVGMSSSQRQALNRAVRRRWPDATLLHIAHDYAEILDFERVLVMDEGRIVADGAPKELAAAPGSPLQKMVEADAALQRRLWRSSTWRVLTPLQQDAS